MRFSALTFNGHRIHYDRPYAMREEGYPGLVVHGPLIAMLLLEELRRTHPDKTVHRFEFKAVGPLFDTAPFAVNGKLEVMPPACGRAARDSWPCRPAPNWNSTTTMQARKGP